ncbi:hypothetical protein Q9K01_07900 [Qipengyuania sp. DY56-A-20]|jgi:hypothetical protein|uniref:Uncharacterized protein n=1 Tax=Qipengyuania benthica TaxID=3067651 RepID=A0ABT9H8A1_9SPHN|nr:hypothetical protein [Qipengyuania sp. DY56-A-20]MBU1254709.1 hypothetical protein [Alphaproteobacteria bacterium]MDP4539540.1 hypothetical protein [Qipengyuania sp. DY56-A-20]
MTDHPSTYNARDTHRAGIQWDDRASLHQVGENNGLLDGAKALRTGTFAEIVRHMMNLPEETRRRYYIEKAGDREYRADEVAELAQRNDFPPPE